MTLAFKRQVLFADAISGDADDVAFSDRPF